MGLTLAEESAIKNKLFSVSGDSVIFEGTLGRVYIRESHFKKGIAEIVDTDVRSIGIFKLFVFNSLDVPENADTDKAEHEIVLKLPMSITMCPIKMWTEIRTEYNDLGATEGTDNENTMERVKYYVLEFQKGSVFIKNQTLVKSIMNLKSVTSLITDNQLPKEIMYTDTAKLWIECSEINGYGSMRCNTSLLEMIVSYIYRNPHNLSEPFRMFLGRNPNADISQAKPIRVIDIAKQVSAFGSVASGDPVRGITSSIIRQMKGHGDAQSPIEEQVK